MWVTATQIRGPRVRSEPREAAAALTAGLRGGLAPEADGQPTARHRVPLSQPRGLARLHAVPASLLMTLLGTTWVEDGRVRASLGARPETVG